MQFDQMPCDREAKAEAACRAADHGFSLPEAVEYEGQKTGTDTFSRVADGKPGFRFGVFELDAHEAGSRREFHGVRQQVPNDLLQTAMVTRYGSAVQLQVGFQPHAFRFGCGPHRIESSFDGFGKIDRLKLETDPAGDDTRYIEHVFDQLGLSFCISFDRFERTARRNFVQ